MAERIVVLCGAGVGEACGLLSTEMLTSLTTRYVGEGFVESTVRYRPVAARDSDSWDSDQEVWSTSRVLMKALDGLYGRATFETYIHALETLEPLALTRRDPGFWLDDFRPVISAYVEILNRYEPFMRANLLKRERVETIRKIFERLGHALDYFAAPDVASSGVFQPEARANSQNAAKNVARLLQRLPKQFDSIVLNLNYDDLLDELLNNPWDGFQKEQNGVSRFDPMSMRSIPKGAMLHLHGSVRFGYLPSQHGEAPALVKFDNRSDALKSIEAAIENGDAARADTAHGGILRSHVPMISGFQKADKAMLSPAPFGYYYHSAVTEIVRSHRVLVLGYSGGDPHMNVWLREASNLAGSSFRMVYVTKKGDLNPLIESREREFLIGFQPDGELWNESSEGYRIDDRILVFSNGIPTDEHGEANETIVEFLTT